MASSSMALPFNLQTETLLTGKSPNEKSRSIQCVISETVFNLLKKYNSLKELTKSSNYFDTLNNQVK